MQAAHPTSSEDEDAFDGHNQSSAGQKAKSLVEIFSLAARVARRSDNVLAAVQTSVRHHLVK